MGENELLRKSAHSLSRETLVEACASA